MSERSYTHKELAALLGVSETTVKSYRRKFPGCIPVASYGKPIRFPEEAAAVALRIRDLFETGMGVADVRARLTGEFDWITEEKPAAEGPKKGGKEPAPELSQGVSNMARSLVDMNQKQKAILQRIEGLEGLLEDLGLPGNEAASEAREKRQAEAREREEKLENRLSRLDDNAKALADTVSQLAAQLSRFLGERDRAAREWAEQGPRTMAEAASLAAAQSPRNGATVIPLRPEKQPEAPPAPPVESPPQEPPRSFFSLPLVARTEQGAYVSAGGRSRGRFSLNDLKAMLIYGFTPPNHFSLRWEAHGQGWWLYLEQEQGERAVHLLLMELPAARGGSVAEILKLRHNGDTLHPAEICSIIDSFGA